MLTIYKYPLGIHTPLALPSSAQCLTVHVQEGTPMVWVLLETEEPTITRRLFAIPTGDEIMYSLGRYIGTFQLTGLVFHVFEEA